jgi:hypothetical protein
MSALAHRHLPPQITDRLVAALLPDRVADAARGLGQACEVCGARLQQAERAQADFLAAHPPRRCARELLALAGRKRRRQLLRLAPTALAAGALLALSVSRDLGPEDLALARDVSGPNVALAGAVSLVPAAPPAAPASQPSLAFSVYRTGEVAHPGRTGERLRAGDVLELQLQAGRFRAAHVFSLDARGRTRPLFDWSPTGGAPPPTIVVDDSPGPQRIVVLFHDLAGGAGQLGRLREAVARTYEGAGDTAASPWHPPDAREIVTGSILIEKDR